MRAFGLASNSGVAVSDYRGGDPDVLAPRLIYLERSKLVPLRVRSPAVTHLGGWTLNVHHMLQVAALGQDKATLLLGDGSRRNIHSLSPTIWSPTAPLAGTIEGTATDYQASTLHALSSGRIVSVLLSDALVIAGGGGSAAASGIPATSASFPAILDVATRDRDIYFVSGKIGRAHV